MTEGLLGKAQIEDRIDEVMVCLYMFHSFRTLRHNCVPPQEPSTTGENSMCGQEEEDILPRVTPEGGVAR